MMVLALTVVQPLMGKEGHVGHGASPYAGQEERTIKSLSASDIAELRRGGWGLAKPAELNGVPGPAHLLELKEQIPLTETQVADIQHLFHRMRQRAIEEGVRLIARERALDVAFRNKTITGESLKSLLGEIEQSRTALRLVHLETHLLAVPLLSNGQIVRYNQLRGYAEDPCQSVPTGHEAAMWKKHNGCG
jgi:hypothetical protein